MSDDDERVIIGGEVSLRKSRWEEEAKKKVEEESEEEEEEVEVEVEEEEEEEEEEEGEEKKEEKEEEDEEEDSDRGGEEGEALDSCELAPHSAMSVGAGRVDSPSPQDIRLLHDLVEDLAKEQEEKIRPRAEQIHLKIFTLFESFEVVETL
ncbi:hypothetical protein HZH68_000329 [Vespula germanica]|uniref:Uncharacterized protein n=1 Tax=Vespula germanica TaxID=30212 RepID=A0A834U5R4_VESGE|nr:hypothetical protein HZH68_000329 [Vespula germanica]